MNELNRLLIFMLLLGLLYALYKYQTVLFGPEEANILLESVKSSNKSEILNKNIKKSINKISVDNISQVSFSSLENDDGVVYKQDSLLGSLDSNSLNFSENNTINSSFI